VLKKVLWKHTSLFSQNVSYCWKSFTVLVTWVSYEHFGPQCTYNLQIEFYIRFSIKKLFWPFSFSPCQWHYPNPWPKDDESSVLPLCYRGTISWLIGGTWTLDLPVMSQVFYHCAIMGHKQLLKNFYLLFSFSPCQWHYPNPWPKDDESSVLPLC
jgi:hypothetical protein